MKKNKRDLFSNIIGYDDIKTTLRIIIDMLNNEEKYKKLGCNISHGLLLYGPPGTGKTSISNEVLNNVKRKKFTIRKSKSNGNFIDYINDIFIEAKNNQPSVILLDDLDKFSETDDKSNNEEFVAIQSLVDDVKNDNIFVIATANDINVLPSSLRRAGRFDIQIRIDNPKEDDAIKIFSHYLKNKKVDDDVSVKKLSYILTNSSCAELEKVCNQAGIYAGFKNKESIGMEELLRASLELKYNTNIEDINVEDNYAINTAYHEAGHALIGELLEPGSVSFITITKNASNTKGITIFHNNDDYFSDIKFMKNRVKALLAGKASTEIVFNTCDVGTNSDLNRAHDIICRFVDDYCMVDFSSKTRYSYEAAEETKKSKADNVNIIISEYYNEVKEMLCENRHILDRLANELKKKKILFKEEIEDICNNTYKYDINIDNLSNLNKKFTFENFVVGNSNKFATTIALSIAKSSEKIYNPLFIYGSSGVGKTHLLNAIGNYFEQNTNRKVLYVSSKDFIEDCNKINCKNKNNKSYEYNKSLKNKYCFVDVLIIDDIQLLEKNIKAQEVFFNIFNNLYSDNKQIIISSNHSPSDMNILKSLKDRFCWGVTVNIFPPEFELRKNILRKKFQSFNMSQMISEEVLEFIATNISCDLRKIESVINRVISYKSINNKTLITIENIKEILSINNDILCLDKYNNRFLENVKNNIPSAIYTTWF